MVGSPPRSTTIFLFQPSKNKTSRESFELPPEEYSLTVKLVKIQTPTVVKPMGVIVHTEISKERVIVKELVLHYDDDEWHK